MFDDFMTMELLTTFVGLTTAVMLIVQFTKTIVKKRFGDGFVRLYAFIVALILTFIFAYEGGQGLRGIILTVINAMLIAIASMGGYEIISDPLAKKS
ncbi:MAG: hypothetical protein GX185_01340 [Tissierellia bacterium]|nr:hypothetical protein [Tissierellia bacterium]